MNVKKVLKSLGIAPNLDGYHYIAYIIDKMMLGDSCDIKISTIQLYESTAAKFGVKASNIERSIRHAVSVCLSKCDPEYLNQTFGRVIGFSNGSLKNSEFITIVKEMCEMFE